MENLKDKKIAVLLSGGVDSSVVVYELARQGLHPDCFYIKIGPEEEEEWDCSSVIRSIGSRLLNILWTRCATVLRLILT